MPAKAKEPTKTLLVAMPLDVREWLEQRAAENYRTMTAEILLALRARMADDANASDRAA